MPRLFLEGGASVQHPGLHQNLGDALVVVDDLHDGHGFIDLHGLCPLSVFPAPRFRAKDTALRRARIGKALFFALV